MLTLLLCGFFAARAAGQYLSGAVAGAGPGPEPQRQLVTRAGVQPAAAAGRGIETIVARNIFCSDCAPVAAPVEGDRSSSSEPTRTTLPLRLLATVIDADDDDGRFASVLDTSSGRTRVAGIGDRLALEARLVTVEERRILLENGGRKEFLSLEEASTPEGVRLQAPSRTMAQAPAAGAVRAVGPGRYEIPGEMLKQALSNTAQLASMARVMPAQLQGQPAGFMLTAIRPGSLYTQLGLMDGDIVQAVNGRAIRTPEDALQVYSALRGAQHLTISVLRRSQPITHDYTVTSR